MTGCDACAAREHPDDTFAYRDGDIAVEVAEVAVAEPAGAAFHYSDGR